MFSEQILARRNSHAQCSLGAAYKLLLLLSLGMMGFALGCGGSGGPNIPITGNFSTSSLKGSYVYNLYGIDTTGAQYAEAGVFTADGNGNITSGVDDFNQPGGIGFAPGTSLTGRYTIGNDGNGSILFTLGGQAGNTFQLAITMVSTSQLYLTEADTFANASGEANLQTSGAAAPNGTYVFRIHSVGQGTLPNVSASLVGAMSASSGSLTGSVDELRNLTLNANASIVGGTVSAPDSTGRGTLTFTDSLGITSSYEYYAINSSTYALLQTDVNFLGQGRLELQSGPPNFSGNYVFGSKGDTTNLLGSRTVGMLTSSGSGITGGSYDAAQDGSVTTQQPFGGNFAMTPNGRIDLILTPNGGSAISEVVWMVNSGRAFYLINDNTKVEDGTMDQQTGTSFSNTSLKGQYAFVNDGFFFVQVSPFLTRVGTFIPDGNGNVNLNEVSNNFDTTLGGTVGNVVVPGTYSVSGTGRATATLTSSSNSISLVMYMASPSAAYVLENDSGTEISGKMAIQVSP